ncbi:hemolysin family protein [Trichothermofontia sp.]
MPPVVLLELLIIFLLVLANGAFAMSEIAIVSARRARLQHLASRGDRRAEAALSLAESPNRFLSTVQVGISLIGIVAGVFGGATFSQSLATALQQVRFLAPYADAIALVIVVMAITYLSLVVGELVPKRLALHHPEQIAMFVARPMLCLESAASPIVSFLSTSTEVILRLFGIEHSEAAPSISEEEIKVMIQQATKAGTFEEVEQAMVERVLRLGDMRVSALMTPRPDIVWLDLEDTMAENYRKLVESPHTRFPVCQGGLDHLLGVVQVNDLLTRELSGQALELTSVLRQPVYVPESTRGLKVMELFKQASTHIALVVDEYGVIQGLVTLNDILEAIIGDIPSVGTPEEPEAVQREDGSWLLDGMMAIDDFRELFLLPELPGEQRGNFHTLGGFVITHLGRIPNTADYFEWDNFRFEVADMDGNRVDKVLMIPLNRKTGEPNDDLEGKADPA